MVGYETTCCPHCPAVEAAARTARPLKLLPAMLLYGLKAGRASGASLPAIATAHTPSAGRNKRATLPVEMKLLASIIVEHSVLIKAIRKAGVGHMVMCLWDGRGCSLLAEEAAARRGGHYSPVPPSPCLRRSPPPSKKMQLATRTARLWRVNLHGSSNARMGLHAPLPAASSMAAQ
ncbi:hypothetical protein Dimus_020302 [Dionaea muscipula]